MSDDSLNAHVLVPVPDPSSLTKTGAVGAPGQAAPKHRCRVPSKSLALFYTISQGHTMAIQGPEWASLARSYLMNDPSPTRPSPPWLPVSPALDTHSSSPGTHQKDAAGPFAATADQICANHKPAAATRPTDQSRRRRSFFFTFV